MIRSSGLALHQACQTTANQVKRTISWPSVGVLPELGSCCVEKGGLLQCPPRCDISPTPPFPPMDEILRPRGFPGCSLRTDLLPMVISALCAQEDQNCVRLLTMAFVGTLCYGSQGPYSRSTSLFLFKPKSAWPPRVIVLPWV